jgi:ribose transport system ATP-binding protein
VADRVLVMPEGRIAGTLERDQLSEEAIVALAVPQSTDDTPIPQSRREA